MADNRMFVDTAASLPEAIRRRDHFRDMLEDDGLAGLWVAGYDRFQGIYRIYIRPANGQVPKPRLDSSESVPVARALRRHVTRSEKP